MFTSTQSGEGKTFTASNVAISFALLGKKAIILGLDIRKPRLAELFEIDDHHHGITPLLTKDHNTWQDIEAQIINSGVNKNLDILMAGPIPPNPAELIARHSLDDIMAQLREHYDYILIDTAPVGLVSDTLQISRIADATVYLCRADYTPKSSFDLINALNHDKKMPKMSIVLNGVDLSKKSMATITATENTVSTANMANTALTKVTAVLYTEAMATITTATTATRTTIA